VSSYEGTYTVTVNGIKTTNGTPATLQYQVGFFTPDITPPTLRAFILTRVSATTADVDFTSNEAGSVYYALVPVGSPAPNINTSGAGTPMSVSSQWFTISNLSSPGAWDLYIVGKDEAGNLGNVTKLTIPEFSYTVTFNANGGSVSPTTRTVAYNAAIGTLPTPTRSGYTFDGWYTAASGGTQINASTKVTANVSYFAHWTTTGFANNTLLTISPVLAPSRVFDIPGASVANHAHAQIYDANTTFAQRFRLERVANTSYYVIRNIGSGKVLDVANAQAFNGAVVQQYTANGTNAQKWKLLVNADGSYTIVTALDETFAIDLPAAASSNGTKLQLYKVNGTAAQNFRLNTITPLLSNGTYKITSALAANMVLDVAAAGTANGANIQIYQSNNTAAQRFTLSYDAATGYYTITNPNARKVIDVAAAGTANGTNVHIYQSNNTNAQKWTIVRGSTPNTYVLYAACSGLTLDVAGAQTANGTNVWTYAANGTAAQMWRFDSA
jgi:uncharacterized repeat protein (TIGR02543 family)